MAFWSLWCLCWQWLLQPLLRLWPASAGLHLLPVHLAHHRWWRLHGGRSLAFKPTLRRLN